MDFAIISLIVSVIMMIVGVVTFLNATKERHEKSAAEQAQVGFKIDQLSESVSKMESELKKAISGYHENHESITALDGRVNRLEGRIKAAEDKITHIEKDIKEYHTH